MAMIDLTKESFKTEVLEAKGYVLVDFWATWCGPCNMLAPIIFDVSKEKTDVKFCKVNVDAEPDLAVEYKVMSIPTILVFKDGKLVGKSDGVVSKPEILAMFN